jgi:RsiW-degrading membrane proteinase PrsW (M82 family)
VSGSLATHPAEAPLFQPAYSPYPLYPDNRSFPPRYMPYPYPLYAWQPPQPKQDGYLLAIAICSVIGSSLVLLGGLGCIFLILLVALVPTRSLSGSQQFSSFATLTIFTCVCLLGGAFGLYHSIRSLMKKPSSDFSLPSFWIFLILYLVVIGVAFLLQSRAQEVAFPALTITLIALAGLFPALTVLALGVRRLRTRVAKPLKASWSTSWRRFTLALVSGSTLSIVLAFVLELGLLIVITALTHVQAVQDFSCLDTPDVRSCQTPGVYSLILFVLAVGAPLIEEMVKPLAVVALIGRVRSGAEAFVLGMACGIGFDIVETSGYISTGYHDWLNVALQRTAAGLLHGLGAAMVALGWYYLVHAKKRRLLLALACWSYAVLQHAIWNGSWGLVLLPAPIGPFVGNWTLNLGFASLPFFTLINIVEAIGMLAFFIYITGKLKMKGVSPPLPPSSPRLPSQEHTLQKLPAPQMVG